MCSAVLPSPTLRQAKAPAGAAGEAKVDAIPWTAKRSKEMKLSCQRQDGKRCKGRPPDNETMETLLWLWDYQDRIKGTRNSILDIKGVMNLVNTLLIPLVAFLIANREAIFELLGWSM